MRLRALFLLAVSLAGCDALHTIGTSADPEANKCCYSGISGSKLTTCVDPTSCGCAPELCGAGGGCKLAADCPAPDVPCRVCSDGSTICPSADCVDGSCTVRLPGQCPSAPKCTDPGQCTAPSGCVSCSDGSNACYAATCTDGVCGVSAPTCKPTTCPSATDPATACPPPPSSCIKCLDGTMQCAISQCVGGTCQVTYPTCPTPQCVKDTDCPQPASPCTTCAGGGTSCPTVICVMGSCKLSQTPCPTPAECMVAADCTKPAASTCPATTCCVVCTADHRCQTSNTGCPAL